MAKTLPIQIVKTRGERDFFNKEAGGGSEYPRWATPEVIRKNAVTLHNRLSDIERVFNDRKTANNPMPLLLTAQINSEATAKSYRPNIRSIFDLKDKRNVIGIEDFTKLFIKVDSEEDVELIIENIQSVSGGYSTKDKPLGVAAVSDLTCFHPDVNIDELQGKTVKVRLINYMSAKYNDMAEKMFTSFCNDNHLHCKKLNYAEGMYVYKLVDVSSDNLAKIATMDSVISVKEMPYFEITSSCDPVDNPIDIAVPKEGEKYPLLGILDTGVAYTSHMAPWQLGSEYNFPGLEESDIERNHGTMVASVAVYGDKLNPECATGCGPLKYVNCIVNTSPDRAVIFEDELVEYVREAIQNNPDVKVWNLSQGSKNVVDDHLFSDFAMALDDIQKQYNVLICKSAGNATTTGERITQGAESVLSLTVGSVCNKGTAANDLPEGTLSPFSRIGLGPEHLQKPEVVHFGGNVNTGVRVLTAPDILYRSLGTSFSTPRVSALAAHLSHMLNQQFDATMIKALIVHNSHYPEILNKDAPAVKEAYGFGIPDTVDMMLYNDEDEFTMIWQPDLNQDKDFQIVGFPFIKQLVDKEGRYNAVVTATIVSEPVLKGSEGNEYCQTDIDVSIDACEKIEYVELGAVGIPKTYRNSVRTKGCTNILNKAGYSKRQSDILRERNLIMSGNKWQAVKKYQVDLSTLTDSTAEKIKNCEQWVMKINKKTRDATVLEQKQDGIVNEIKTTVIITISDPMHRGMAYNEGIRLLNNNNFVHTNVMVRNEVHIEGNAD